MLWSHFARALDLGFEAPPIVWGGNAIYEFSSRSEGQEIREFQNQLRGELDGNSFIWQPWFITVNSRIDASQRWVVQTNSTTNSAFGTKLGLEILPLSNYPVSLNYNFRSTASTTNTVATEGQDASVTETTQISNRVSASSRVKWDPTLDLQANGDIGVVTSDDSESTDYSLGLYVDKRFQDHNINATLRHAANSSISTLAASTEATSQSDVMTLRHRYSPWTNVFYDSTSTVSMASSVADGATTDSFQTQAASTLVWTPEDIPLRVTGAWRSLTSSDSASTTTAATDVAQVSQKDVMSLNGQISASYNFSSQLRAASTVRGSFVNEESVSSGLDSVNSDADSGATTTIEGGVNADLSYTGDRRELFTFAWGWDARGTLDGAYRSDAAQPSYGGSISIGQSASKNFDIPLLGPLSLTLSENGSSGVAQNVPSFSVDHAARFRHQRRGEATHTSASISFSDNRGLTTNKITSSQFIDFNVNNSLIIDRFTRLTTDAAIQLSKSYDSTAEEQAPLAVTSKGSLAFVRSNLWSVPGLNFSSTFDFSSNGLLPISFVTVPENDGSTGSTTAENEDEEISWSRTWTSSLNYTLGLFSGVLQFRLSQNQTGVLIDETSFRITRRF